MPREGLGASWSAARGIEMRGADERERGCAEDAEAWTGGGGRRGVERTSAARRASARAGSRARRGGARRGGAERRRARARRQTPGERDAGGEGEEARWSAPRGELVRAASGGRWGRRRRDERWGRRGRRAPG